MKNILCFSFIFLTLLDAQIKITATEILPIPKSEQWTVAVYSPTGDELYLTNSDYSGIWQYSLTSKLLKEITRDKNSGYNFIVSEDGSKIVYRRTAVEGDQYSRVQEIVETDLQSMKQSILEKGNSLNTPVFIVDKNSRRQKIFNKKSVSSQDKTPVLIGIEDTKIALLQNGEKSIVDPFNNGQYVWPQLSPDKTKLVAVEMDKGAFIYDLTSKVITRLGKCNSPQWTKDGAWIIGMNDKDDGHSIYGSEIIAVSSDGSRHVQLTETPSIIEMFPTVSPKENSIVLSTMSGDVMIMTFVEGE